MDEALEQLSAFVETKATHSTESILLKLACLCHDHHLWIREELDGRQEFQNKCSNFEKFSQQYDIKEWTKEQIYTWWDDGTYVPKRTSEVEEINGLASELYGVTYELEVLKLRGFDGDEEMLVQTDMAHLPPVYPRDTALTIETPDSSLSYRVRDTLVLIQKDADGVVTKISHQVRVII